MNDRKHHLKAKQELQQMLVEFYERFSLIYKRLRLKHLRELKRFKVTHAAKSYKAMEYTNGKISNRLLNGTWV